MLKLPFFVLIPNTQTIQICPMFRILYPYLDI